MNYHILDSKNNKIGETLAIFENDSGLIFLDINEKLPVVKEYIDTLKVNKLMNIKEQTKILLADTEWRLQRATERDSLGIELLESETPKAIMSYREAVRRASNRAEIELNKLRSVKTVNAFTWQVEPTDYPSNTALTHLEFLRRFTSDERVAISAASAVNPVLADYMKVLDIATMVNLSDVDVAAGINVLEQAGIISEGRAAEILS